MLKTKALYNLLRINSRGDQPAKADPWALENLRVLEMPELWRRLKKEGIALDQEMFFRFADEASSPEELGELVISEDADPKTEDRIYLVLFELWRRLLPERPSLSIFCDELDHQIDLYDSDQVNSDEAIQDGLSNLVDVLEENVDAGIDSKKAFSSLSQYCAHDLESFLYDYIDDLIDQGNTTYASDLLEQFSPYITETQWFGLLAARIAVLATPLEAVGYVRSLLSQPQKLEFLLEILRFLVVSGDQETFRIAVNKALPLLKMEDDFQDVLDMSADYFRRLDRDELDQAIVQIKKQRAKFEGAIKPNDPDLKKLQQIIS